MTVTPVRPRGPRLLKEAIPSTDPHGEAIFSGPLFPTPISDAMEALERTLGGGILVTENGKPLAVRPEDQTARTAFEQEVADNPPREVTILTAAGKQKTLTGSSANAMSTTMRAQVIPSDVVATYRMTDYYYATEGDVRQIIMAPIEVAIRPITVSDRDKGIKKFTEMILGPDYLNVDALIPDLWLSKALYGVAYPYEIWSERVPDRYGLNAMARGEKPSITAYPQSVTALNPRFIYVGESYFSAQGQLFVSPTGDGGTEMRRMVQERELPPMSYNSFSSDVHEYLSWAWNIPLAPGACTQLRDGTVNGWVRYPWPALMTSFRTLSTRQVLEEMIRATIEGTRNQLWAFLLGDPKGERRATRDEIDQLKATVAGLTGRRTGQLVWGGHLRIENFAPKVEDALANAKWESLTEHLRHQQGMSRTIMSGPSTAIPQAPPDGIDIKVFIERMTNRRDGINTYLRSLVRKIFLLSGSAKLIKRAMDNDLPTAILGDFGIEQENRIKNSILPQYSAGLMSPQTAMGKAGMNYDVEIANHQAADKDSLMPPASFAQAVVTKDGQGVSTQTGGNGQHGKPRDSTPKTRRTGSGGVRGENKD